ncbi:MAG TPA: hypothetical protein VN723_05400 [Rhizomicrobium sp.]|jgi:hypothetical protein|nr:hypothetical protein [Rhizomicrobium sp.]
MAKVVTLFLFFATALAAMSVGTVPATAPEAVAIERQQPAAPTPQHALTGIAFHATAAGF